MRLLVALIATVCITAPALAQTDSVLVRREKTVTGTLLVRDVFGQRLIDCTPAVYERREKGRVVRYRREVDCPYPGANAVPTNMPQYRNAQPAGINQKNGYIILK